MLCSDKNRERTAYTCIMYIYNVYVYIIIFFTYIFIYLYIAFFCLKFISFFFLPFFRGATGMPTDVAESVRTSGRGFQDIFFFLFFFRSDKRKVPSSPRPPHIFNTRFVLHFFSFFFSSFFLPVRTGASRRIATHACVFHDSNYFFFFSRFLFLILPLAIVIVSLIIIVALRLLLTNCLADVRSIET